MYLWVMFVYMGYFQQLNLAWPFSEWLVFTDEFPLKSHCFCSVKVVVIYTVSDVRGGREMIK